MSWKWDRPQHQVNYGGFKQKLVRKPGWNYSGVDNYGMKLIQIEKPVKEKSNFKVTKSPPTKKAFDQDYWKKQGFNRDPKADIQNL